MPLPDSPVLLPLGCSWQKHLLSLLPYYLFHLLVTLPAVTEVVGSALETVLHTDFYNVPAASVCDALGSSYGGIMQCVVSSFRCCS